MISTISNRTAPSGYIVDMSFTTSDDNSEYIHYGFGALIKYHRKRLGLSQKELAVLLDEKQNTVSTWEARDKPINNPLVISKLAEIFDVPAEDIELGRVKRPEVAARDIEDEFLRLARVYVPKMDPHAAIRALKRLEALSPEAHAEIDSLIEFKLWQERREHLDEGEA